MLISTCTLDAIRARVQASLDIPVTLERLPAVDDRAEDVWGNPLETGWAAVTVAGGKCNLAPPTAKQLAIYADAIGSEEAWKVRFPSGTNPRNQDRVTAGGLVLRVVAVLNPESYSTADQCIAAVIRGSNG